MIRSLFAHCAFFTVLAVAVPSLKNAAAQEVRVPVAPKELLKTLPACPPEWKLAASNAKHIPKGRPLSKAYREYCFTPPPGAPGAPPLPACTVKITIVDTAADPDITGYLTAGETAAGAKRLTVDAMPALRIETPGETDHLEALALQRFVVKIAMIGQGKDKAEDWLKRIDLQALRAAAAKTPSFNARKEFILVAETVDELQPRRNRSSKWALGGEVETPSENPQPVQ